VSAEVACEVALANGSAEVCARACSGNASCSVEPEFAVELARNLDASVPDDASASDAAAATDADADASATSPACPKRVATITCTPFCYGGRGTSGVGMRSPRGDSEGAHFAQMAELEAISVLAFARMATELEELGAPPALVASARRASSEESAHAAAMADLAATRGAAVLRPPPQSAFAPRSLFELARENAREGCVREAYGAVLAAFAAVRAEDPAVRAVMARIADEEACHAQLSWELHAWSSSLLTETERATVLAEMAQARKALRGSLCEREGWGKRVGLPSQSESLRLLDATETLLFAA